MAIKGAPRKLGTSARKLLQAKKLAPPHSAARVTVLVMESSPEYFDFVAKIQKKTCTPKTGLFRLAFREFCLRYGHGAPPEL